MTRHRQNFVFLFGGSLYSILTVKNHPCGYTVLTVDEKSISHGGDTERDIGSDTDVI